MVQSAGRAAALGTIRDQLDGAIEVQHTQSGQMGISVRTAVKHPVLAVAEIADELVLPKDDRDIDLFGVLLFGSRRQYKDRVGFIISN